MFLQPIFVVLFAICSANVANCATVVASSTTPAGPSTAEAEKTSTSVTTEVPAVVNVTDLPETELTTIIEIEETETNSSESLDFVNLPGYGVIDEANSTGNASQFSCYNRRYGYYADIAKKCYMFHLCYPVQEPTSGQLIFQRFSFVCSDNAIFDQQNLVCVDNDTLTYPCSDAHKYFIESNNKLIESMQQNAAAAASASPSSMPPQLSGATAVASSSGTGEESSDDSATIILTTQAAESAESPLTANSTAAISQAEAAQQYALLEQLFG